MDFEAEISGLLDDLTSVQSELLEVLAEKRIALATADMQIAQRAAAAQRNELSNASPHARIGARRCWRKPSRKACPARTWPSWRIQRRGGKPSKLGTE